MPEIERLETRFGTMFHDPDDEVIGRSLRRYGQWAIDEIALATFVMQHGPPGDFIDLGANVGAHTVAIAALHPDRLVFAVEANPRTFQLLCANITANGLSQARAFNYLVADRSRICRVASTEADHPRNLGAVAFRVLPPGHMEGRLMLAAAVDDIYPADRQAAFLKIDLEGMESAALEGARETLRRCHPAVYFENGTQASKGPIFDLLHRLGYETFWHINFPFDEDNMRGETLNLFGAAVEIGTVAVHGGAAAMLRESLTPTTQPMGEVGWHQCAALSKRLRAALREREAADGTRAAVLSALRQRRSGEIGPDDAAMQAAQAGRLPAFADLRRATLVDLPDGTLRELLAPLAAAVPMDEADYLRRHPDVAAAVAARAIGSAREHYAMAGYFEGRQV